MTAAPHWEHFSHQADIGVRGVGDSPGQAFEQAALALTAVAVDPGEVEPLEQRDVSCAAPDLELLLVEWLNAIVYETAVGRRLFSRFRVIINDGQLSGRMWGEPIDRDRHRPAVEVKGATLTALKVVQQQGQWLAQCVVDV